MRRYGFLTKNDTYSALNRLRDAFLAAKNGNEVNEIIDGLLTPDEKIRIGRRILIAEALQSDEKYRDISQISNVGYSTILWVSRQLVSFPVCFELLFKRRKKLETKYNAKKYKKVGSSQLVFKKKVYTGVKRSNTER